MPPKTEPERRPLRVPTGSTELDGRCVDGAMVVRPGDGGYDDAYATASYLHAEYGDPMPYADEQDALPGGKAGAALDAASARTSRAGAVADASGSPLEREGRRSSVAPPSDHGAARSHPGGPRVVAARAHEDDLERIKRAYLDWAGSDDEEAWQHLASTEDDAPAQQP